MDKEIRRKMIAFLDEKLAEGDISPITISDSFVSEWGRATIYHLTDLGALEEEIDDDANSYWMLTVHAHQVRGRLAHPRLAWLQDNWFQCGVLFVTLLVGIGTIVSNFVP